MRLERCATELAQQGTAAHRTERGPAVSSRVVFETAFGTSFEPAFEPVFETVFEPAFIAPLDGATGVRQPP